MAEPNLTCVDEFGTFDEAWRDAEKYRYAREISGLPPLVLKPTLRGWGIFRDVEDERKNGVRYKEEWQRREAERIAAEIESLRGKTSAIPQPARFHYSAKDIDLRALETARRSLLLRGRRK